jgi:cytochrome c-type biogenesis protein
VAPGDQLSLALAFAAGVVSFASPCVLALVPVYLAFLSEAAASSAVLATPAGPPAVTTPATQRAVLAQAVLFVIGFSLVFIALGISAGLLGGGGAFALPGLREGAGLVIIGLGIATMLARGPFATMGGLHLDVDRLPRGRLARSIALGGLVGIGWTPCLGAVLGAILTLAGATAQVGAATLLLVAYSAGLAVPFLLAAVALPRLRPLVGFLRRHHRAVELVTGAFIVIIGLMILTNTFARLASFFPIL